MEMQILTFQLTFWSKKNILPAAFIAVLPVMAADATRLTTRCFLPSVLPLLLSSSMHLPFIHTYRHAVPWAPSKRIPFGGDVLKK